MRAELRDYVRAAAKLRRPKPPAPEAKVTGRGFTQNRGAPIPRRIRRQQGR